VLDAWGTRESGILEANVRWPGHYYECRSAVAGDIRGKWCNSYLGFKYVVRNVNLNFDLLKDRSYFQEVGQE